MIVVFAIAVWIILGLIAGVIANLIWPRKAKGGIFGAIMLGIAGAILGGFLGNLLFGIEVSGLNLSSIIVAVVGALILLLVGRNF